MSKKFVLNPLTGNLDLISEVSLAAVGSTPNANAASLDASQTLNLQPADATHPGVVSTTTQSFGGNKTFANNTTVSGTLNADGGIDRSTSGTLTIGATNSSTINIGNSGATVNIQGTTIYENTPHLIVADPLITVNSGGGAGSGQNSGIEIEENSIITGYAETSSDRNSWTLKAPNTAGVATITPGASGITLNQSSHDPVTLTAVGAFPNANGASLSSQALTLQPADTTNPGVLTSGTQSIGGQKTLNSNLLFSTNGTGIDTVSGGGLRIGVNNAAVVTLGSIASTTNITLAGSLIDTNVSSVFRLNNVSASLPLKTDSSKNVISQAINLASATEVTGSLPINRGGTNSATTLNNNRVMQSSGGAIVEAAAITANKALASNASGIPVATATTDTELGFVSGVTSAIQTQLNNKPNKSAGDINETSFSAANNISSPADVTSLLFPTASVRSAQVLLSVFVDATSDLFECFDLLLINKGSSWNISVNSVGDVSGFVFSVTNAGQVQYVNSNYSGFSSATLKYRAITTTV